MDDNSPATAPPPRSLRKRSLAVDNRTTARPPRTIDSVTSKNNSRTSISSKDGETVECSSLHCKACTAVLIADGVAVCCCPLAVISLLAFAFIKVPYMAGKRCLGLHRKRKAIKYCNTCWKKDQQAASTSSSTAAPANIGPLARSSSSNSHRVVVEGYHGAEDNDENNNNDDDIVFEFGEGKEAVMAEVQDQEEREEEEEKKSLCAGFEAERFFLELYQVGQFGFGRVSFTGIQL